MKATAKASMAALMIFPLATPAMAQGGGRSVDLRVGIKTIYDSNSAGSSLAAATGRDLDRSEWRILPNITAAIAMPFGRHSFSLTGLLGYDIRLRNSDLNRERINVSSAIGFNFPRCNANLSGSYSRSQSDLGEILVAGSVTPAGVKNVQTERGVDLTVGCGAVVGLRPFLGAGYSRGSNNNPLRQFNDRDTLRYTGGVSYVHPSIGNVKVFASRSETRFDNQLLTGTTTQEGYDVTSYGVAVDRDIGAALSASGQVSWSDVDSRGITRSEASGLNWLFDVNYVVNPQLNVSAQVSRTIGSSLAINSEYHRETLYSVAANYALTPRTSLQATYSLRPRKFYGFQSAGGVPAISRDKVHQGGIGLTYAQSPRMNFSLRGGVSRRTAPGNFYNYTNYTAEAGVDFRF